MTDTPHVEIVDRFAMIPETLLYDPKISSNAKVVYCVLHRHGNDPENCYPGHARIGRLMGASKRSVPAWIIELEQAGWVERFPRVKADGSPDSNGYRLYSTPRASTGSGVPVEAPQPETGRTPRAAQRGVRATQRGGVRAVQRGGYAPANAPKESHGKESHQEGEGAVVTRNGRLDRFARHVTTPPRLLEGEELANALAELDTELGEAKVDKALDGLGEKARYKWPSELRTAIREACGPRVSVDAYGNAWRQNDQFLPATDFTAYVESDEF